MDFLLNIPFLKFFSIYHLTHWFIGGSNFALPKISVPTVIYKICYSVSTSDVKKVCIELLHTLQIWAFYLHLQLFGFYSRYI